MPWNGGCDDEYTDVRKAAEEGKIKIRQTRRRLGQEV